MDFDTVTHFKEEKSEIIRFEAGSKHGIKALMVMDDLRKKHQLCDVFICVGNRRISAHKVVLASFSSYFMAMFTGDMVESQLGSVTMKDVDPSAIDELIEFAYTGKLEITTDTVQSLLYASSLLQLTAIQKACSDFLMKQLHPSNCLGIRCFADAHACTDLLQVSEKFIFDHFVNVVENEEFLLLPRESLIELLSSEDLNVESEEQVYNAVITWAKHDQENRKVGLAELIEEIRLPLLSPQFLVDYVEKEQLIAEDIACRNLLDEAKNFHMLPERRSNISSRRINPRKSTVGMLYSVGGMDATGHSLRSVERYDFKSGKVRLVAPMMTPRSGVSVAVLNGKLYAVGGHDGNSYLNSCECYDPASKQWKQMAPMSTSRRYVALGELNGMLYVVGGYDGSSVLDSVEVYDAKLDQWKFVASLNNKRRHVAVAVLNGFLYAVGGHDGSSYLKSVERYDPDANMWSYVSPMGARRGGVGVCTYGNLLYATGGYDGTANLSTSERYYPEDDKWTFVAPMNICRSGHGIGVLGDLIYAVGGHDGVAYLSTVEYFDTRQGEWKLVGPMGTCRAVAGVSVLKER